MLLLYICMLLGIHHQFSIGSMLLPLDYSLCTAIVHNIYRRMQCVKGYSPLSSPLSTIKIHVLFNDKLKKAAFSFQTLNKTYIFHLHSHNICAHPLEMRMVH